MLLEPNNRPSFAGLALLRWMHHPVVPSAIGTVAKAARGDSGDPQGGDNKGCRHLDRTDAWNDKFLATFFQQLASAPARLFPPPSSQGDSHE
jgi:hypothetical protein